MTVSPTPATEPPGLKIMAAVRAVFAIDVALNIMGDLVPAAHHILPIGGSQIAQAGVLAAALYVCHECRIVILLFRRR